MVWLQCLVSFVDIENIWPLILFFMSLNSQGCHRDEVNLSTVSFADIPRFRTVVSVCLSVVVIHKSLWQQLVLMWDRFISHQFKNKT